MWYALFFFVLHFFPSFRFCFFSFFLFFLPDSSRPFRGRGLVASWQRVPILKDALAYMECTVKSRLETADHWVTYAEVADGNVSKAEGRTASHHRKVGDYY